MGADLGAYVPALDGDKGPCRVRAERRTHALHRYRGAASGRTSRPGPDGPHLVLRLGHPDGRLVQPALQPDRLPQRLVTERRRRVRATGPAHLPRRGDPARLSVGEARGRRRAAPGGNRGSGPHPRARGRHPGDDQPIGGCQRSVRLQIGEAIVLDQTVRRRFTAPERAPFKPTPLPASSKTLI